MSALRYFNLDLGSVVGSRWYVLDLPHDEETVNDATENDVFLVKEVAFCAGDEKLKAERNISFVMITYNAISQINETQRILW